METETHLHVPSLSCDPPPEDNPPPPPLENEQPQISCGEWPWVVPPEEGGQMLTYRSQSFDELTITPRPPIEEEAALVEKIPLIHTRVSSCPQLDADLDFSNNRADKIEELLSSFNQLQEQQQQQPLTMDAEKALQQMSKPEPVDQNNFPDQPLSPLMTRNNRFSRVSELSFATNSTTSLAERMASDMNTPRLGSEVNTRVENRLNLTRLGSELNSSRLGSELDTARLNHELTSARGLDQRNNNNNNNNHDYHDYHEHAPHPPPPTHREVNSEQQQQHQQPEAGYADMLASARHMIETMSHTINEMSAKVALLESQRATQQMTPQPATARTVGATYSPTLPFPPHRPISMPLMRHPPTNNTNHQPPEQIPTHQQQQPQHASQISRPANVPPLAIPRLTHIAKPATLQQLQCSLGGLARVRNDCPPTPQSPATSEYENLGHGRFALRLSSKLEVLWYADRTYPPFSVSLVDTYTAATVTHVTGWVVALSLVDGHQKDVTDKLSGRAQSNNHRYPVTRGQVNITGVRFSKVSSKCGGYFQLVLSLFRPNTARSSVRCWVSDRLQILSYRLYHCPKLPNAKLKPEDKVSKMKGIGSMYAKRLSSIGLERIEQLGDLDVQSMSEVDRKQLLGSLRKDRGALTLAKLESYVDQAKQIVQRARRSYVSPAHSPMNLTSEGE